MILKYNDTQMLDLWRLGAGLAPSLADTSIERFDNIDIDRRLLFSIRAWYLDYLTTAPRQLVPVTDIAEYATVSPSSIRNLWSIDFSCDIARVFTLTLPKHVPVQVIDTDTGAENILASMSNRFTRLGSLPKAFHSTASNSVSLYLRSTSAPKILSISGTRITDDNVFLIDERVLRDIPRLARAALAETLI